MDQLEQEIINLLAEKSGVEASKILMTSQLNADLQLDGLNYAEFLMDCEDAHKIDISLEDAERLKTVEDLMLYVRKKHATRP